MKVSSPSKRGSITKNSRPGSPLKKSYTNNVESRIEETVNALNSDNQRMQFDLAERDVEIERMKTTLIALNEKLQVFNDLQKDVAENQQFVRDSEAARE